MNIRQEVPLRSFSIGAYVVSAEGPAPEFLLLKRAASYLEGTWQMVTGMIEKNETAWEAALREIKEETGIRPDRFYNADLIETFYLNMVNCINLAPIFVAVCEKKPKVRLQAGEHSEYRWVSAAEAVRLLSFSQQIDNLLAIDRMFFQRPPAEFLRIEI